MPENRFLPMNWVPRWMEANYNTDSLLRNLYSLGIVYYNALLKETLKPEVSASFYGQVGNDRYLFLAKYSYPETYIPHITLHTSGAVSGAVVERRDTLDSLLYEHIKPVYFKSEELIHFKNLDVLSFQASALSGTTLNVSSQLASYPKDADSPFILENSYGDIVVIDSASEKFKAASGLIITQLRDTSYTIHYRATSLASALVNETSFIKIDGAITPIKLHYIENVWDKLAKNYMLTRNKRESNTSLKSKIQHLTIAKKANQKIAAMLGYTVGLVWYASGSAVSTSGFNDWEIQDFSSKVFVKEFLTKDGSSFVFSFAPSGHVDIICNGIVLDSSSYTISGSYLHPNTNLFKDIDTEKVEATYTNIKFRNTTYPRSGGIYSEIPDRMLHRTILVKEEIVVKNVIKKIKDREWVWNGNLGLLTGAANFDF